MDTSDLNRILISDECTGPVFRGTMARDVFITSFTSANTPNSTNLYVFNTHRRSLPGEHWIGVAQIGTVTYYFDSYGRHPYHYPDVLLALSSTSSKVVWNNFQLQGLTTTACGDYCVLFCLLISRGWNFKRIIHRLVSIPNREIRDHLVRNTIIKLYGRDAFASLRTDRRGLTGKHKLHIKKAVNVLLANAHNID